MSKKNYTRLSYLRPANQKGANVYKCECGGSIALRPWQFEKFYVRSCGCLQKDVASKQNLKHGHNRDGKQSPEYKAWVNMIVRCYNEKVGSYESHGARGITVCDRWKESFVNFLEDMGLKPEGLTLERIDNDGNYEPGNCKWATTKEQSRNKRSNVMVTYDGKTQCIADWAAETGLSFQKIANRLNSGWPVDKALTIKVWRGRTKKPW